MSKILVVEDNDMIQEILVERLQLHDYAVVAVENGLISLTSALQEQPDIILMDMSLPVMDGWEATRRLKADDKTRHIPIIALTAHSLPEDREACFAAGCDDYEIKPIDFPQLIQKIEHWLAQ